MTWALFLAAFSMGLFGSPHCLGMCGGIVTAFGLSMQHVSDSKKNGLILTYHLGRLISYSLLGLIASVVGVAIFQSIMSNSAPRIVLGVVLVLIGLAMLGLPLFNQLEKVGMRFWQSLAPLRKKVFPIDSFGKALFAGLLWGFLPWIGVWCAHDGDCWQRHRYRGGFDVCIWTGYHADVDCHAKNCGYTTVEY